MSWGEIYKAINSNLALPLNKQLEQMSIQQIFLTKNATYIVPVTGKYRVTCIGKGGNGTGGGSYTAPTGTNTAPFAYGNGGIGGGGGGASQSILDLTANQQIAITVSDVISSFGAFLSASAGNGQTAGAGSGGNVFNLTGTNGLTFSTYTGGDGGNCALVNGLADGGLAGASSNGLGGKGGKGYMPFPLYFNTASGLNDLCAGTGGTGGTGNTYVSGGNGGVALLFPNSSKGTGGRGGDGAGAQYGSARGGGGGGGGGYFGGGGGGGGGGAVQGTQAATGYGGAGGIGGGGIVMIEFILH